VKKDSPGIYKRSRRAEADLSIGRYARFHHASGTRGRNPSSDRGSVGCYELFGTSEVRSVHDLKGDVSVPGLGLARTLPFPAWQPTWA